MQAVKKILITIAVVAAVAVLAQAEGCQNKLFSVTIKESLSIGDALDNLAETCGLTVVVKDSGAHHRLKKKLYYIKLKNSTLRSFLNTLLKDNDLNYELKGNKLTISYLITRTFKVHYVAGERSSESTETTSPSTSTSSDSSSDSSDQSGGIDNFKMTISHSEEFKFWKKIKDEIHKILVTAGDGGTHYTKVGDAWIGPDGQKWEYNPMEPVVNPEAGMITVTGTARQIERVSRYISTLMKQIKTQVMIDVRILSVKLDNSKTTGIDWNQLYGLQNVTVDAVAFTSQHVGDVTFNANGITDYTRLPADSSQNAGYFGQANMHASVSEIIKFLSTQGDVTSISSSRVMTMNNQPALVRAGQTIYYKLTTTNQLSGADNAATQGEEVNSVFAGITLNITPEVDERGMVTLKINPSISRTAEELTAAAARSMPPDLVVRQISSVITVRDGDHAILGGLIIKGKGTRNSKVPLLGDLPLVGYAFNREEVIDNTEELVIIITPHIIKNGKNISLKNLGYSHLK